MEYTYQILTIVIVIFAIVNLFTAIYFIIKCHYLKQKTIVLERMVEPIVKPIEYDSSEEFQRLMKAVIDEKLYADLHLDRDRFAARMNLSRHALNKIIIRNTNGLSFPQWINNIRLDVACDLLKNEPDKPISVIAKEVGLTPNNFHRLFRLQHGVTPTRFRLKQKLAQTQP